MKIINISHRFFASIVLLVLTINLATPKGSAVVAKADAPESDIKANGLDGAIEEIDEEPLGGGKVEVLTESNFEKLTQVATGATTGDWFIKFYAPWCGHCRKLEPAWNELAQKLDGQVNVAKVDVTTNKSLGKRFDVKAFPTLLMFSHGKVYKYTGARKLDNFVAYAKGGFKDDEPHVVQKPTSGASALQAFFEAFMKDMAGVSEGKAPQLSSIAIIVIAVVLLLSLVLNIMPSSKSTSRTAAAARSKVE